MKNFFITGTDTGVGKTFITAAWTQTLRRRGIPALALKPISCGDRSDAEIFAKANDETLSLNQINPVYLAPPLSPYAACVVENRPFDTVALHSQVQTVIQQYPGPFLIEGVGGWRVPLTHNYFIADWARDLQLPVVLIARAGLGTLNHCLLTIDSIRLHQCLPIGIILNFHNTPDDMAAQTNPAVLENLTSLPVFQFHSPADLQTMPDWMCPA